MRFIKTTVLGGVLFLVPLVVGAFVIGKAFLLGRDILLKIDERFPNAAIQNPLVLNAVVALAILAVCFIAGLFAKSTAGKRIAERVDAWLLGTIPMYSLIRGVTQGLRQTEEESQQFVPVIARFDDNDQLAFEVERTPNGRVALYVPGCPNPWSGSLVYVDVSRVHPLGISVNEALKVVKVLGRGSTEYAQDLPAGQAPDAVAPESA